MNLNNIIAKLTARHQSIMNIEDYRKSAVLIPLINVEEEIHLLFEVRSMELRRQPGDICFPGGRIDQTDLSPKHGAIRETSEELGIDQSTIQEVYPLDYIVSDSGRIIYPYVGILTKPEKITPNQAEVSQVFTIPLNYLLRTKPEIYSVDVRIMPEANFPFELIIGGKNYDWQTRKMEELFYRYEDKVIWGLTAKILEHFLIVISDKSM